MTNFNELTHAWQADLLHKSSTNVGEWCEHKIVPIVNYPLSWAGEVVDVCVKCGYIQSEIDEVYSHDTYAEEL